MYSFPDLEPVSCSVSNPNCYFLSHIQVSQEAGKVICYSHLLKNFAQFLVIHIVKGFGIVNKAEIDVFLELSFFFHDPVDVGNLISGSSAFSKTSVNIRKFTVHILLKDLHDLDNHDGVITHLEPDILECEVKWALGSITMNHTSGGDGIPVELLDRKSVV